MVRGASFRLQMCDAVRRKLKVYQLDFTSAFLQSPIDGEIYIKPPPQIKVPCGYVRPSFAERPLWSQAGRLSLVSGSYRFTIGCWFRSLSCGPSSLGAQLGRGLHYTFYLGG